LIPFLAVVKKELASVARDRTITIAILIQLFIASFSSGLLLGMLSLYDSDTILRFNSWIRIGVVDSSDNILGSLISERGLQTFQFATLSDAQDAYVRGEVLAIVDTPRNANGLTEIKLYLPESNTISSLVHQVLQEPLKQYENVLRIKKGVDVHYTDLKGKPATSFEFVYSVLIPLLMFFPAFVSGSMTADAITEEVENNTLQTLLSAPLTLNGMVGAKILSSVILSILQCIAWLTLLIWNKVAIQNTGWILLLAVVIAGITSTFAALSAVLLKDRERSQFVYSLMLLTAAALSTLLNLSPIVTLSRLALGDIYTSGWNVAIFALFLAGLYLLLSKTSRRLLI